MPGPALGTCRAAAVAAALLPRRPLLPLLALAPALLAAAADATAAAGGVGAGAGHHQGGGKAALRDVSAHAPAGLARTVTGPDVEAPSALMRKERRGGRQEEASVLETGAEATVPTGRSKEDDQDPLARKCFDGGTSGPDPVGSLLFAHAEQSLPPITLVARIRTSLKGSAQTVLGWGSAKGDSQMSAVRLTEDGNLEYIVHDGWKQFNVSANPPVRLADGEWHTVAVVREGEQRSIGIAALYADGILVGEGYLEGLATHLTPWITTASILPSTKQQQDVFQGDVKDVRLFDEALSATQLYRLAGQPCTVPLTFSNRLTHSNLGGMGPDDGERGLRFINVTTYGGRAVDLLVTNLTFYFPKAAWKNGVTSGGLARFNVESNEPTRLAFRFVQSGTDREVFLDSFLITFVHAEQSNHSLTREAVTVENPVEQYFLYNQSSEVLVTGSTMDSSLTFASRWHGDSPLNISGRTFDPTAPLALSLGQVQCAYALRFLKSSGFHASITVMGPQGTARDFYFAGNSSVVTDGVPHVPL